MNPLRPIALRTQPLPPIRPMPPPGRSLRKELPGGGGFNGGTTNQPGITPPVGDALLPLCLLAFCYLCYLAFRARKHRFYFTA